MSQSGTAQAAMACNRGPDMLTTLVPITPIQRYPVAMSMPAPTHLDADSPCRARRASAGPPCHDRDAAKYRSRECPAPLVADRLEKLREANHVFDDHDVLHAAETELTVIQFDR
jgi:hypothetical protein